MQVKIGFISKNICVPWSESPVSGALLIEKGKVVQVVEEPLLDLDTLLEEYQIEDLGDLFIMPGLVDINVEIGAQDFISVTQAAISGGVTTIATIDRIQDQCHFFTDIAQIGVLKEGRLEENGQYWAYKAYISPITNSESLSGLEQAVQQLEVPLIVYPEYSCKEILSSGTKRVDLRKITEVNQDIDSVDSESDEQESPTLSSSQSDFKPKKQAVQITPFIITGQEPSVNQLTVVKTDFSKLKRGSVSIFPGVRKGSFLVAKNEVLQNRHKSVFLTQQACQYFLLQDIPFMDQVEGFQEAYQNHKAKYPVQYELNAIQHVMRLKPQIPVHFCNLSSYQAVKLVETYKNEYSSLTCETSFPYLYYNEGNIKRGDRSYKVKPPIRDGKNQVLLWDELKEKKIDCVTSYHQPRSAFQKMIGPFKEAMDGISSIGLLLQAVWTRLKADIDIRRQPEFICKISEWVSQNPARILGMKSKGSLERGKDADFLVFDPNQKQVVKNDFHKFKSISPILNDELDGVVLRTYLRGQLVFSASGTRARGKLLRRN